MAMPCSICNHPQRADIEAALLARQSNRAVARQFGLSKDAVARHKDNCLAGAMQKLHAAQDDQALQTVADKMRWMWLEAHGLYLAAKTAQDGREARCMLAELRAQVTLEAKLAGELDEGGNFLDEWLQLRTALLAALAPWPEVAETVLAQVGSVYAARN